MKVDPCSYERNFMQLHKDFTIKTCDKTLLDNIVKKLKTIKSYKAKIDDVSTLT